MLQFFQSAGAESVTPFALPTRIRDLDLVVYFSHTCYLLDCGANTGFFLLTVHRALQSDFAVMGIDVDILRGGSYRRVLAQVVLDPLGEQAVGVAHFRKTCLSSSGRSLLCLARSCWRGRRRGVVRLTVTTKKTNKSDS